MESDSLTLVQTLKGKVGIPWCTVHESRQIIQLLSQMEVTVSHTYRENNKAADYLSNLGCKEEKGVDLVNFVEFP